MGTKTFFLFFFVVVTGHEYYSSTDKMTELVQKEKDMLELFSLYIDAEEEHLMELKKVLLLLKLRYILGQSELAISNPVAAYKLMERVKSTWKTLVGSTIKSYYQKYQDWLESEFLEVPHQKDLDGAARGIIRLQEIYTLYPQNITKDPQTGTAISLTPDDAYHLGIVAYEEGKFQHAFLWFYHSLSLISKGVEPTVTIQELLRVLSLSAFKYGNIPYAIYFTQHLVNLEPTNEDARLDLVYLKRLSSSQLFNPDIMTLKNSSSTYEALCRGETTKKVSRRQRQLSCKYSTSGGNPRLMYAPVKVEEIWNDPPIVRYYDIISDGEIELLKNLSRPEMQRSQVYGEDQIGEVSQNRVSQSTGFSDEDDPVVNQISQRLSDISGLNMESAEFLAVMNYGIGGHFGPHYDAGETDQVAAIIIYLSDVQIGGATVFPLLGVSVKPEKGSAVMWYNLLRNGQIDELSMHAGCPVYQGTKWIATKWVHEEGQEFIRPCSLYKEE